MVLHGIRFAGYGSYVPDKVLTNFDFEKMVDTTDEWIVTRTGIRERHIAEDDQATSDLAYEAGRRALDAAGVTADELDALRARAGREDLEIGADATGLLVDDPGEVVDVVETDIEPPPASIGEISGCFISGVVMLEGELLALLDVHHAIQQGGVPTAEPARH